MSVEQNIQAQQRWGEAANHGKLEVLDEVLAEDIVDHDSAPGQRPGREGIKGFFADLRRAFPDLHTEVDQIVAADDKVAIRYTIRGTHEGDFMGIAPTGRGINVAATQIARYENGKAVERWGNTDQLGLLSQLGAFDDLGPRDEPRQGEERPRGAPRDPLPWRERLLRRQSDTVD